MSRLNADGRAQLAAALARAPPPAARRGGDACRVGTTFDHHFDGLGWYRGAVVRVRDGVAECEYDDGQELTLDVDEVRSLLQAPKPPGDAYRFPPRNAQTGAPPPYRKTRSAARGAEAAPPCDTRQTATPEASDADD